MKDDEPRTTEVNMYLGKAELTDLEKGVIRSGTKKETFSIDGVQFLLFAKRTPAKTPRWAELFEGRVDPRIFGKNSASSAVLAVQIGDRCAYVTFGRGRHMLVSEKMESNFGLRVALNAIDADSLRSLDRTSFETQSHHSREQASKATEFRYFGIDTEKSLLKSITGHSKDTDPPVRLYGMDALKLSAKVDLDGVFELLKKYVDYFEKEDYKKGPFAWVDKILPIKDKSLSETLDNLLLQKINADDLDSTWMALPEIISWATAYGFRYTANPKAPVFPDVDIPKFKSFCKHGTISLRTLQSRKIFCVDGDGAPLLSKPAYSWIYSEIEYKNSSYLLTGGAWYQLDQDYVSEINDFYNKIERWADTLPEFDDECEGDYNKRVCEERPQDYCLVDKALVYLSGASSGIEPCDIFSKSREFIHVKRYGGSSVLSHCFNQGLVSGESFQASQEFREKFAASLPTDFSLDQVEARPPTDNYTVVYAIVSKYEEPLTIPFFSRVSLKHAVKTLQIMGYKVKITKVETSAYRRALQRIPAAS